MRAFIYKGEIYIRCIPAKSLFHSNLVHEVVNRGDIFALQCSNQKLTIVPGNSEVEHIELECEQLKPKPMPAELKAVRDRLAQESLL